MADTKRVVLICNQVNIIKYTYIIFLLRFIKCSRPEIMEIDKI